MGLDLGGQPSWRERDSMQELVALCQTARVQVLHVIIQKRHRPDPACFVGKGKAEQLRGLATAAGADTVVVDDELTPAQARNLEELLQQKVVDRAQLIMNIFAMRAHSKESKLQVQLAQLEYLLPRMRGWAGALGQPGAGIGTRGPGEMRLEVERRRVREEIQKIKARVRQAAEEGQLRRKRRERQGVPVVALVGYTNSGKSTLLNRLCHSATFVEDKLFATLDPLARRGQLADGRTAVFIDTVGFIRKLPHQLIPAFRSTLEAVREADLLLIVLDAAEAHAEEHWRTINSVLDEVFAGGPRPPQVFALNKIDSLRSWQDEARLAQLTAQLPGAVAVSARQNYNLDALLGEVASQLAETSKRVRVQIPYAHARLLGRLRSLGRVTREEYEPDHILIEAALGPRGLAELSSLAKQDGIRLTGLT